MSDEAQRSVAAANPNVKLLIEFGPLAAFGITYFFVFPPDTEMFAQVIARMPRHTAAATTSVSA